MNEAFAATNVCLKAKAVKKARRDRQTDVGAVKLITQRYSHPLNILQSAYGMNMYILNTFKIL